MPFMPDFRRLHLTAAEAVLWGLVVGLALVAYLDCGAWLLGARPERVVVVGQILLAGTFFPLFLLHQFPSTDVIAGEHGRAASALVGLATTQGMLYFYPVVILGLVVIESWRRRRARRRRSAGRDAEAPPAT
jgi:hypothetical protein